MEGKEGGFIKLYRKSTEHWLYNENRSHTKREAWEDMLLMCNHTGKKQLINGELIECNRGQSIMSLKSWANTFNWSIQQVRTFFSLLEKDGMINKEGLAKTTRITICNYGYYQDKPQADNMTSNIQTTHTQQANNKQLTTNKNDKECSKNEKNILSQVDKSTLDPTSQSYFEIALSFWQLIRNHLRDIKMSTSIMDEAEYDTWVDPIRLLIENDNHTLEELREVFKFLRNDEFWIMQIRSTAKLRKKDKNGQKYFNTILTIARNEKNRKHRQDGFHSSKSEEAINGAIRDITGH
ncbi:hypothetical protein [Draconibacterium orientale]|uniref:hypothetical protein n=1 Tax=Draconibacterium orientale TaxID=1168034 RepID=UPI002ABDD42C|nr:hypothetical protein [Draconibacterium orientale]